jgi:hypothetical protein
MLYGCANDKKGGSNGTGKQYNMPAGKTIASDSMAITEDDLNKHIFSVEIITTEESDSGKYAIDATWGFNMASSSFSMPRGGEGLQPVLRRGSEPYSYIVGFFVPDDTMFHEYYSVTGIQGNIVMKYIKAYTFQ